MAEPRFTSIRQASAVVDDLEYQVEVYKEHFSCSVDKVTRANARCKKNEKKLAAAEIELASINELNINMRSQLDAAKLEVASANEYSINMRSQLDAAKLEVASANEYNINMRAQLDAAKLEVAFVRGLNINTGAQIDAAASTGASSTFHELEKISKEMEETLNDPVKLCVEDTTIFMLPCGHHLTEEIVDKAGQKCPLCRKTFWKEACIRNHVHQEMNRLFLRMQKIIQEVHE
jgi:chromosome segregation ATPase